MITHVDVIGLGGTGSKLIEDLVRLLLNSPKINKKVTINLVDGDEIESKNIERAFSSEGVGDYKVNHIKQTLINSFKEQIEERQFRLITTPSYINKEDYEILLEGRGRRSKTLCIAAVDNDDTRRQLIEAIDNQERWVMFMSPGNEETTGQVISWLKERKTFKGKHPFELYPQLKETKPSLNPGSCNYMAQSFPQLAITNMTAANETLNQVYRMLEGVYFDIVSFDTITSSRSTGKVFTIDDAIQLQQ